MRGKVKGLSLFAKAALALICLIIVIPIIVYIFPFTLGADGSYTVMSGSMSPALSPGDLVIVKGADPAAVEVGDMLTVRSGDYVFTHRVVERLEGDRFRVKGDANEEPDQGLVEAPQIVGRVVLVFPFNHLYTPYGFAAALLVPAALIIGKQVYTIHQSTKRRNRRETMRWRRKNHSALGTGTLLLALILMVSTTRIIAPRFIGGSSSYFSDVEWGTGFFSAGIWKVPSEIECHVSPSSIKLDQSTTIHVNLKPPHSAEVTIEISTDSKSWTVQLTSNPERAYNYKWTPDKVGSYNIKASWEGDDDHYGAISETVTLLVEPKGGP